MAGAAQDRMQGVAEWALQPVAIELAIRLHVPDGGLDGTAPLDHRLDGSGDASCGSRATTRKPPPPSLAMVREPRTGLALPATPSPDMWATLVLIAETPDERNSFGRAMATENGVASTGPHT